MNILQACHKVNKVIVNAVTSDLKTIAPTRKEIVGFLKILGIVAYILASMTVGVTVSLVYFEGNRTMYEWLPVFTCFLGLGIAFYVRAVYLQMKA